MKVAQADTILKFLAKNPYRPYGRKEICLHTKVPYPSSGTTLSRMVKDNLIIRTTKGFFQHPSGLVKEEFYPFFGLHGLKFESRCYKMRGWSYLNLQQFVTMRFALCTPKPHKNGSLGVWDEWETRPVKIQIHPELSKNGEKKELIEIWIRCSKDPLNPLDFLQYCNWIVALFGIPAKFWTLKQRGINIDFPGAKMEGTVDVSMPIAKKTVWRIYQKSEDFRVEIHDTQEINGEDCIDAFRKILQVHRAMNGGSK